MPQANVINNLRAANIGVMLLLVVAMPFDNAMFHFVTFLLLIMSFLTLTHTGWGPLKNVLSNTKNVQIAFLFVVGVMLISNFSNQQIDEAWRTLIIFVVRYWLLMLIALYLFESGMMSLSALLGICLAAIGVQFLPFVPHILDGSIFSSRFEGFSSNPNVIGLYAGFGVLMSFYAMTRSANNFRAILLPVAASLMVLSCLILLASGSRASWLATFMGLSAVLLFYFRGHYKTIIPSVILIGAITVVVFLEYALPMQRLELLVSGYPSLRDEVWQNSLGLYWDKPILGYGLDTRAALLQNHHIYSEHNIFLSVLVALGGIGLIAYFNLLFRICWQAWKNRNLAGLAFMTFLLSAGMFGFDFYRDQHFMVSFALISTVCLFNPSSNPMDR